jgi:hypothetical protein
MTERRRVYLALFLFCVGATHIAFAQPNALTGQLQVVAWQEHDLDSVGIHAPAAL